MGQEHQARLVGPPEEERTETDSVSPAQLMFLSQFLSAMTSFISKVYIGLFSKLLRQYNSRYSASQACLGNHQILKLRKEGVHLRWGIIIAC